MSHQSDWLGGLGSVESVRKDPGDITQLVGDVRQFADALQGLKEACRSKDEGGAGVVTDRLAELLRVLKSLVGKHQALNSNEILSAAGTLITKVKGLSLKEGGSETRDADLGEISSSIEALAFTFGNVVSDFLMGDVDGGSRAELVPSRRSTSLENLSGDPGGNNTHGVQPDPALHLLSELTPMQKVDQVLLQNDTGVESALLYAKAWSKYAKDVLSWVEKRLNMDMECSKSFSKMAESAKSVAAQQDYMPFRGVYVSSFESELDYSHSLHQTASALQTNKFIQPLVARKVELDKLRKELKEQWQRELKKMSEAEAAVRKAQLLHAQRREEYEKARRTGDDLSYAGPRTLEKKKKIEEEALQKAEEAQDQYRCSVADSEAKKVGLEEAKSKILTQLRELIFQCDLTLKAVTVNWFQLLHNQMVSVPQKYQTLCDQAKQYDPGQCYSEFVHSLPKERVWLEALSQDGGRSSRTGTSFKTRTPSSPQVSPGNPAQVFGEEGDGLDHKRLSGTDNQQSSISPELQGINQQQGSSSMCSDSESAGGSSETRSVDSPTASPGDFKRRLPRTPSTGTMSSADDLDERDPSDNGEPATPSTNTKQLTESQIGEPSEGLGEMITETANSPGPFRNTRMSKAAQTHKLRKMRAPSKCRECDSLVVFHGAECEECSLACHKKCLETLAIQCGHKKLQGRLHLFGIDFTQAAKNSSDGIPFIVKKCTSEIESRALNIKGIYRVNGAKSRVEKLCQAFENGKDLVELSDLYPHDISNVLKLYLRQLPEPLILYRFYNEFIGLAKEAKSSSGRGASDPPELAVGLKRIVFKIRDLLKQLPPAHYRTLSYLIAHLHRVTEHAEENKMTASNLGIIFGPTLIKPRQAESDLSLSSLVDYPYQALMVELFVRHHPLIFDVPLSPAPSSKPSLSRHSQSLLDIKEQSSKSQKRYSTGIRSSHSVDEGKEVHLGSGHVVKEDRTGGSTDTMNGVGSSSVPNRPGTYTNTSSVRLRPQRTHYLSRPVSLPVDRLLSDHSDRALPERESLSGPGTIAEGPESETAESRPHRSPFVHTHTLRRTWDKQYRHYDVTPRTAKIVANLPASGPVGGANTDPATAPPATGAETVSAVTPNCPYTVSVRPFRTLRCNSSTTEREVPLAFRAPRTLQPPSGTFYRPPQLPQQSAATTRTILSVTLAPPRATLTPSTATPGVSVPPQQDQLLLANQRRRNDPNPHREAHFV